jgi:NAD(P)-dependent dehydrogenase (short-subunit alcohol dehydrogenase family)
MKLLILGATGHVGRLLVEQALRQGHDVTAFVRNPAKLQLQHPRLAFFKGDARDPRAVAAAMGRADAVLSALGHTNAQTTDVQTAATRAVLANLRPGQRFISLTGFGVRDPQDPPLPLGGLLTTLAIKAIPGQMYQDGQRHADLIRASAGDWILVRAPRMTATTPTKPYRAGYLPVGLFTTATRTDVANFMLANLTDDTWLRQAPLIISA